MQLLVTGASGFTGQLLLQNLAHQGVSPVITCLVRASNLRASNHVEVVKKQNLNIQLLYGDSSLLETWNSIQTEINPDTIVHIASIRHVPVILESLSKTPQKPRLIVVGTTGVYSEYNQYSATYKDIERELKQYTGSSCLLRPTMIYGSHRDKNLHKLIRFCNRYRLFPVFGPGETLLQPVHADDLAQALVSVLQNPKIQGAYNLSGGSVVTFRQLLTLVGQLLDQPVRQVSLPLPLGLGLAALLEAMLGRRSPVRREQILRLQEDKAFSHNAATQDFGYSPRTLEIGLAQEIEIMRQQGII